MSPSQLGEVSREPEKLPRRERENLRQREEILQAALRLFSDKGYNNVSMHEIAKEAEFGMGTLYKYFNNKEELYKALIKGFAEKVHHAFMQALAQEGNPLQVIREYIAARREVHDENQSIIRLYFAETRGASFNIKAGLDQDLLRLHDEGMRELASVFERGIKENIFRALDPYHMALALDGIVMAFLFRMMEDPAGFRNEDKLSSAADIFFRGVLSE